MGAFRLAPSLREPATCRNYEYQRIPFLRQSENRPTMGLSPTRNWRRFASGFLSLGASLIATEIIYRVVACGSLEALADVCSQSTLDYAVRAGVLVGGTIFAGLGLGLLIGMPSESGTASPVDVPAVGGVRENGRSPHGRMRWRFVIASVGCAVLVAGCLLLVPIPQQFRLSDAALYDPQLTCSGIAATSGSSVNFQWATPSFTYFAVVSCSANEVVYYGNGTSGAGSFVSVGGIYSFGSLCPGSTHCVLATVWGKYTAPVAPV